MATPGEPESTVIIGIGEYHVGSCLMSCIGLGSCIGLVVHDRDKGIGSLAHVMLPTSQGKTDRPAKYADTAIPLMIEKLEAAGSHRGSLQVKMAGGASMFKTFSGSLNIGERNVERIFAICKTLNLPVVGNDTGGTVGRTIFYHPCEKGKVAIRRGDGSTTEI